MTKHDSIFTFGCSLSYGADHKSTNNNVRPSDDAYTNIVAKHYNLGTELISPISTKELGQFAPRPLKSGLRSERLVKELDIEQPSINECLNQIIVE